jgi:hypothetical protein
MGRRCHLSGQLVMAKSAVPVGYKPGAKPILPDADSRYLDQQLQNISNSISTIVVMTPQPATEPPKVLMDGMWRLARSPWRPLSGQTADQWVWYDATAGAWKAWS